MSIPTIQGLAGLTADPETRHGVGNDNQSVTNVRLAFNDSKYENGQWVTTKTFFVDAAGWDHVAERAAELSKGDQVYVEGRIETQVWQDKDTGQNRSKPHLRLRVIRRLERPQQQLQQSGFGGQQPQQQALDPWESPSAQPAQQSQGWGSAAPADPPF